VVDPGAYRDVTPRLIAKLGTGPHSHRPGAQRSAPPPDRADAPAAETAS
jgi:hypothetical protein